MSNLERGPQDENQDVGREKELSKESEREFPKELCAGMNTEELRGYLDFFNQSIQVGVGEFMIAREKAEERHKSWLTMKERQKKIIEAELEKRKERK